MIWHKAKELLESFVPGLGRKEPAKKVGLVLSGGGSRAAYQVGALRALHEMEENKNARLSMIFGSSVGAVNGVLYAAALRNGKESAVDLLETVWRERTLENTFGGSLSLTLIRSLKIGFLQYLSPGPKPTTSAIFDPGPLRQRIDELLFQCGGASVDDHPGELDVIGVMTTVETNVRRGLLLANSVRTLEPAELVGLAYDIHYTNHLSSSHALASAALPSVMPPVELEIQGDRIRLVDGGIAENIPVDSAVRFGANAVISIDISGDKWWCDYFNKPHYTPDPWRAASGPGTFCMRPKEYLELINRKPFGPVLRETIGTSTHEFIRAFGPTWPIYRLLKNQAGEEVALEMMSYAVIFPPYIQALIEIGYNETKSALSTLAGL